VLYLQKTEMRQLEDLLCGKPETPQLQILSEKTVGWRKLHNEELHNLYSSPSIITMIKSRRMRWAGHVT
jgi:hypothetical protein